MGSHFCWGLSPERALVSRPSAVPPSAGAGSQPFTLLLRAHTWSAGTMDQGQLWLLLRLGDPEKHTGACVREPLWPEER